MEKIKDFKHFENYIYYPIEIKDIQNGYLFYDISKKYSLKLLHDNLKKLKEFLFVEKDLNLRYYTKVDIKEFSVNNTILNEKGTIAVNLPFYFEINNIYKL